MKLYNTLSRTTGELRTLERNVVKLYTCGLTVYSQPHIGNWVGYIYWDVLHRTLIESGYRVVRTQNYTDVGHLVSDDDSGEDKMEKGAKAEGKSVWDIAKKYIEIADIEAYDQLRLLRPTYLIRATDYIPQQIEFVQKLEEKDYTYIIPDEGVYFDTGKLADYGKLALLDIDGLKPGARVPVKGKRNITDFALWKFSPKDHVRDMDWESPWGFGFPGWHLECSVIAQQTLGDQIDIHTGGIDHISVHHTNEIAQTEALTGKPFASYWMHNNHLKVDGKKMSKSLGNIYTLQDVIDKGYSLDAFKLFVLSKHYTTEGNFTWANLEAAQNRLQNFKQLAGLQYQPVAQTSVEHHDTGIEVSTDKIIETMQNNLNSPEAIKLINLTFDKCADGITANQVESYNNFLSVIDRMLGLNLSQQTDIDSVSKKLILDREKARDAKDWHMADEIRDQLLASDIGVRDTPNGTLWFYT